MAAQNLQKHNQRRKHSTHNRRQNKDSVIMKWYISSFIVIIRVLLVLLLAIATTSLVASMVQPSSVTLEPVRSTSATQILKVATEKVSNKNVEFELKMAAPTSTVTEKPSASAFQDSAEIERSVRAVSADTATKTPTDSASLAPVQTETPLESVSPESIQSESVPLESAPTESVPVETDSAESTPAEATLEEAVPEGNTSEIAVDPSFEERYGFPNVVYLHWLEPTGNIHDVTWAPEVLFERASPADIAVDLSDAMQSEPVCNLSNNYTKCLYLIVTRESRGEDFFGQLLAAEDTVNRIRSGVYGDDIKAILANGYSVEFDSNGNYHIYDGHGKEMHEPNEGCKRAVDIALAGSNISKVLLEAVTTAVNEKYGLDLGSEYSEHGAFYHFNAHTLSDKAMNNRRFQRAPVMFQFENHTFQGCWIPTSMALDTKIKY